MLDWLRKLLGLGSNRPAGPTPGAYAIQRRGVEAAKTTRVNQKHWQGVGVSEADAAIIPNLETTRARCRHEIRESGHARGIVETYVHDLVGKCGPTPQVQVLPPQPGKPQIVDPDAEGFAEFAEDAWSQWCEVADASRRMHWCEILAQNVKQFFGAGEYLYQRISDRKAKGVQLRLLAIAPERLGTPWTMYGDPKIRGGVEIDDLGAAVAYHILDSHPGSMFGQLRNTAATRLPAADIRHVYRCDEPGQTRGEPWLGPVLDDFVQLRDFISDTVVAARIAATMGSAWIHTKHPQAQFQSFENQELPIMDIEAGVAVALPEGWEANQLKPEHPATTYSEFVKSRLAAFGRPVGMPYLRVACDASGHNYSSAKLDLSTYWSGVSAVQGFIERQDINHTFREVVAEAALAAGRRVPRYEIVWMWPPAPAIDDVKEAEARKARLESGTSCLAQECAATGNDWQQLQEQQKRERENAERLGIPYPQVGSETQQVSDDGDGTGDDDEKAKDAA